MKIVSVTGTKGKSTIVRVIADVLFRSGIKTLRVDTTGYYVNEKQQGTLQESKDLYKLVTTVAPGRYLFAMKRYYPAFSAILECSLGCTGGGLGYRKHDVGIFTNVMEDHLGSLPVLKTKRDIARYKRFIFKRIRLDGYAVFNADDQLVCEQLDIIDPAHNITFIPVGLSGKYFDIKKHLSKGGVWITLEDNWIVLKSKNVTRKLLRPNDVGWTFEGKFMPSVMNLMLVLAGLYAHFDAKLPKSIIELVKHTRLDPYGGRLTLLENKQGVKVLVDYAHEKQSLRQIGRLAQQLATGKTIGIVRIAFDRTDKLIKNTGQFIANDFDQFVVYDKIDGYWQKPKIRDPRKKFTQEVGRVSKVLFSSIKNKNPNTIRVVREDKAIAKAAKMAGPGDVVVLIANDADLKRSINWAKKYFKATFV